MSEFTRGVCAMSVNRKGRYAEHIGFSSSVTATATVITQKMVELGS